MMRSGGRPADDAREDGQRAVVPGRRAERDLRAIEVDVVARAQLGDALLLQAESRRRRGADADLLDPRPEPLDVGRERVSVSRFARRNRRDLALGSGAVGVARMTEQSAETQPRQLGDARDELGRAAARPDRCRSDESRRPP